MTSTNDKAVGAGDDRPITGWHDILELAAEAGFEPVGPTFNNGMNFAAAFQVPTLTSVS